MIGLELLTRGLWPIYAPTGEESPVVRLHSNIARFPWSRLWYLCRALDPRGRGWVELSVSEVRSHLNCAHSTIWHWLQSGREVGAFRSYHFHRKSFRIYYGSLLKISQKCCQSSGWGAAHYCSVSEIGGLRRQRAQATLATIEAGQTSSYYLACKQALKQKKPLPASSSELIALDDQSFLKPYRGELAFVAGASDRWIFVSRGFTTYGTSQATTARKLGISTRTVQRHLGDLQVPRRQLAQSKPEYGLVEKAMLFEAPECFASPTVFYVGEQSGSSGNLYEVERYSGSSRPMSLRVYQRQFFHAFGKTWITRCNLYQTGISLSSMRFLRNRFKFLMRKNSGGAGYEQGDSYNQSLLIKSADEVNSGFPEFLN